jgi:hypothetical protein
MRLAVLAAVVVSLSLPAMAQEQSDTLKAVTSRGIEARISGISVQVAYKPDGTFENSRGLSGTWKAVGDKLCVTIPGVIENQCDAYPPGKKSGDTFEVIAADVGLMMVTIK